MSSHITFAKRVFFWAGVYGLIVMAPQYFLEAQVGRDYPPAITHPEHFYGFIGLALAWQLAFLAIARQPQRLRPVMPAAVAEKFLFGASTFVLLWDGRAPAPLAVFAAIDVALGVLFLVCFVKLGACEPCDDAGGGLDDAPHGLGGLSQSETANGQ